MGIKYYRHHSSFRDPDGFVFYNENNIIFRQINLSYQENYDLLIRSGLYDEFVNKGLLIPHHEVEHVIFEKEGHYKTICPEQVPFISYPYEWCFEQLKDAALLTLELLKRSLDHNMALKDATPFNIQFFQGKCIFIDTCSFEKYEEGQPWIAYRQFCESFLAPLLLSHYSGADLNKLLLVYPDGIPLPVASKLLPLRSWFNLWILLHVHFQATYKRKKDSGEKKYSMSRQRLYALTDNLRSLVSGLSFKNATIGWTNYYSETVTGPEYVKNKQQIIESLLDRLSVETALDLGANEGYFSEVLAKRNITTVSADFDANCVNLIYKKCRNEKSVPIHPLVIDIAAPTPAIGWDNNERSAFLKRNHFDLTLALAIIHHLAFVRNIPLEKIAETFSSFGKYLLIEFVPKSDIKVKLLLADRKDIFVKYDVEYFEDTFLKYYHLIDKQQMENTGRIIYLLEKKHYEKEEF